jgi:hypothetical protein
VPCFKRQSRSKRKFNNLRCETPLCYSARRFLFANRLLLSLSNTVLLDLSVWALCVAALLAFARLSVTHPATSYLIFHGWFVSARSVAILNGAPTLFSWRGGDPVSGTEICHAVLLADAALMAMTCAWILAANRCTARGESVSDCEAMPLRRDIVQVVAAFVIPIGAIALLLWSKVPGFDGPQFAASWAGSNWAVVAQSWAGLGLLALIYFYGFRLVLIAPFAAYLALAAYQGNFRFRLLIPAILLVQIYVDWRGKRWPPLLACVVLFACATLFFPLKGIGQALQSGAEPAAIWRAAEHEITDVFRGTHPDEMVLDQFASALTLADQHGKLFLGKTYAGILTVAIPREWWPEKPGLADFEKEISTAARPVAADGMVVTMLGEFYVNFSSPGVILLSLVVAYVLGAAFHAVYRQSYFTLARFAYLLVACNLIEVYRDGLVSLFVFVVINMMPLTVIVLLHLLFRYPATRSLPILQTARVRQRSSQEQPVA